MLTDFKITYSWEKRPDPEDFSENDYVDWSKIFQCLRRFLAFYKGEFVVHIGDLELYFDLDPDLSTIFEALPEVLESLTSDTVSLVVLDFFEQGTDIAFLLERHGETITLRFEKGLSVGYQFRGLPDTSFALSAITFLAEWIHFAEAILDALVALQPDIVNDESYRQYSARLIAAKPSSQ
jgi:hypothetical protein